MKKIVFILGLFGLMGCTYSIKNNSKQIIKVAGVTVGPGECTEGLNSGFFGLGGDFPVTITDKTDKALHGDNDESYDFSHYAVNGEGKIEQKDEPCVDKPKDKKPDAPKKPATTATGTVGTPTTTTTTPTVTTGTPTTTTTPTVTTGTPTTTTE